MGWGKKLSLSLVHLDSSNWYSSLRDGFFSGQELYHKRSDDIYDLAYFEPTGGLNERYFPIDADIELTVSCIPKKDLQTPSPSCRVRSNYKNGIVLEYSYSRDFFQSWKQIDANLKAMFDRFEQTASAAEHVHTAK